MLRVGVTCRPRHAGETAVHSGGRLHRRKHERRSVAHDAGHCAPGRRATAQQVERSIFCLWEFGPEGGRSGGAERLASRARPLVKQRPVEDLLRPRCNARAAAGHSLSDGEIHRRQLLGGEHARDAPSNRRSERSTCSLRPPHRSCFVFERADRLGAGLASR